MMMRRVPTRCAGSGQALITIRGRTSYCAQCDAGYLVPTRDGRARPHCRVDIQIEQIAPTARDECVRHRARQRAMTPKDMA
jgi:hypothetical protein